MASPKEKKGSTAIVHKAQSVGLPVELWWLIVESLAASSEQFELMYLREVNSML